MSAVFTDNTKEVLEDINRGVIKGMLQGGEFLATNIQKETPVVTGNLKQSIKPDGKVLQTQKHTYTTDVTSQSVYAAYVEYGGGTRRTKNGVVTVSFTPRAMFRKGAARSEDGIEQILKNNLK